MNLLTGTNERTTGVGLLLLRIGTGALLLYAHGWGKLLNWSERHAGFADPIGLGPSVSFTLVILAEVVCSTLLVLGFLTRFASVPIAIFALVAAFVQHLHDPFSKKELALLYLVPSLTLLFTGPGRFSVDAALARQR